MRILIIEDQENIAKLVKDGLEAEGFAVDYVLDGEAGQLRIELSHQDYDLILLDLMLPKKDGIEICKFVREKKINTPILMLTAKDGIEDITAGLNVGADDYLVKPFSFQVLIARIRAILRRPKVSLPVKLEAQNILLDITAKKLFKNNKEIKLTLKEFNLLEYLMRNPNRVLNREQILSNVWDFSFDSFSNVVDVHITNLRKKLGDKTGKILETVHGVGYKINA
ncbi:MAG: Two component transcriptional regulator, winged helix family [Parcubacteria group bacterium GW2011_GWE2_39_37]|uniref:Two component transcriptional regulator, winged helix family n=1 Tax=Candidatus Falkowbacteria bacterium GW2011_GWF2_39_8 TaxID=1618642 RepID=A0A0G0PYK8_9BACT|nr:MAG: Two component transcriptional regulator, winged helix family [Parcubacteria group bacterium GW2011_GWE2_39_37]KKR33229.1 MAG: Two component transcriptional regulator, winged helix family [Candidatus Falkowbacteria bacterium GW2011_GWF2_39_8]